MKLSFDYYHSLEAPEIYLCNPDERELFPLPGRDRKVALRFNDLSELKMTVDDAVSLFNGEVKDLEAYDYIRTKRLLYVTGIGWFRIKEVDEDDNGLLKSKAITAESYQSVFKDKGFISEERVYRFYNAEDPLDSRYNSSDEGAIPSVLGQWYRQLGIRQALQSTPTEPQSAFVDWTVTYVSDAVKDMHRSFTEKVTYGYDFMVNDVEDAFKVVVLFDFMYKAIQVKTIQEVTEDKAGVIYTFSNFMKNVRVNENADDIVTVLNCNGGNCDITMVNPTGTNYICDFSYYMDEVEGKWMSPELIAKLKAWKSACVASEAEYIELVENYRAAAQSVVNYGDDLQYVSTYLTELKNARDKRSVLGEGNEGGDLCGIVRAEHVKLGEYSLAIDSTFESERFDGSSYLTAYNDKPDFNAQTRRWTPKGVSTSGTADDIASRNAEDEDAGYWYFIDDGGNSYCKLKSRAVVDAETKTAEYYCDGFDRFIAMLYPVTEEKATTTETTNEDGETITETKVAKIVKYVDGVQDWIDVYESQVSDFNYRISYNENIRDNTEASLKAISSRLNILSYFANTPSLLRELNCYWIEGDYTDENISVLDTTTPDEEIDLCKALLEAGKDELSRVSQPRFSFSLESIDATKNYEFRDQMEELVLGRIITIEKEEGLWYYPALLELNMNLDKAEDFGMTFANALRLDDWGYSYADLIKDASTTSRQVSANWQSLMSYAKERETIRSIIRDPLDLTLRAAYANMTNQEFSIGTYGILGRKRVSEDSDSFEDEQVRLINNVMLFTDDNWKTVKTALGKITLPDPTSKSGTITKYGIVGEVIIGDLILGNELMITNNKNGEESTITISGDGITIKNKSLDEEDAGRVTFKVTTDGTLILRGYAKDEDLEDIGFTVNAIEKQIALFVTTEEVDSRIEVLEGEIGLRVTSDEYNSGIKVLQDQISLNVTNIEGHGSQIKLLEDEIDLRVTSDEYNSGIEILEKELSGKVSNKYTGESFGWELTDSAFKLISESGEVLVCTKEGLVINGYVQAEEFRTVKSQVETNNTSIAKCQTEISSNANQITLRATKTELNKTNGRVEECEGQIVILSDKIDAIVSSGDLSSELELLSDRIDTKVSNKGTGNQFGWSITEDSFTLFTGVWDSGAGEGGVGEWIDRASVFVCDSTGVWIEGSVYATQGKIGVLEIRDSQLRSEVMNGLGETELEFVIDGGGVNDLISVVYQNNLVFELTPEGDLVSSKCDFSGGTIGCWTISGDRLYTVVSGSYYYTKNGVPNTAGYMVTSLESDGIWYYLSDNLEHPFTAICDGPQRAPFEEGVII